MPSLDMYKKLHTSEGYTPVTDGLVKKMNADMIMDATWDEDIASRVGYLYDWYHDDFKTQLNDMHPEKDLNKTPIDIKYLVTTSQTYAKDYVNYHLQLRPHQQCNVEYYDKFFKNRYDTIFPCGLYCDIQDNTGKYNRWLVVGMADYNDPQFPTFELLRCDKVIQYVLDGVKYNVPGVLRSQNS